MTDQRRGARLKSATLTDRLGSAAGIAVSVVVVRFQLDFDSTGVRRAFDCLSNVIEISDVTRAADRLTAVTLTYLFI